MDMVFPDGGGTTQGAITCSKETNWLSDILSSSAGIWRSLKPIPLFNPSNTGGKTRSRLEEQKQQEGKGGRGRKANKARARRQRKEAKETEAEGR